MRMLLLWPLLLVGLVGAEARAPAASPARPALWKLADADTTIYLFGTIHVLPRGVRWRTARLDRAIAAAGSLTLEVVLDQDPAQVAQVLATLGKAPAGTPPLAARVPAARRATLARMVKASGAPAATLDSLKTWAAAIVLTAPAMRDAGLPDARETGVESELTRLFRAAGKPVDGLETIADQFGFFDALPEAAQRDFLRSVLDDPAKSRDDLGRMTRAWMRGDVAAIARTFAEEPEFTPALRDLLIVRRDRNWAGALARRLAKPGASFVAVGAGHLAGPDSVQRMLAARGLAVTRVQ